MNTGLSKARLHFHYSYSVRPHYSAECG